MMFSIVPIIAAGITFTCTPIRVWDADGPIWCAEGPRIRLAGIAAREHDETCRSNQPCPTVSGIASRDYLVSLIGTAIGKSKQGHILVRGEPLKCYSMGDGVGVRTAAWCSNGRGDLSTRMIQSGYALKWEKYWHR